MGFEPTTFCLASRQAYIIEQKLLPAQPSHSLLRILNLSNTRISVFLFTNHSLKNIIGCPNLTDVKYPGRVFKESIKEDTWS